MQKNQKKASILIWSIILSLMLGVVFISISTQINLNFKQNINFERSINNKNLIERNLIEIEENFKNIYSEAEKLETDYSVSEKNNFINEKKNRINGNTNLTQDEKDKQITYYENNYFVELKKYNISKFKEKIESLRNISKDINILLEEKNEEYSINDNNKLVIIIPPLSNIFIKSSGKELKYSAENITNDINKKEKIDNEKLNEESSFNSKNIFRKITIGNTGGYSKISIIEDSYLVSPKKEYKVLERYGRKEIIRQNGFIIIK